MRLVSARQEAHYRGYRIEGAKQGTRLLLRVIPTRPDLPILKHSRFWTLRAPWVKAVETVCSYIDDAYETSASQFPPKKDHGANSQAEPTVERQVDKLLQLQAQLLSKMGRPAPTIGCAAKGRGRAVKKGLHD
jgi:hypothetical protein